MSRPEHPLPGDILAWLELWEATQRDRDNDELAHLAGNLLVTILADRGVIQMRAQRPVPPA